jgi:hypothetical protein
MQGKSMDQADTSSSSSDNRPTHLLSAASGSAVGRAGSLKPGPCCSAKASASRLTA